MNKEGQRDRNVSLAGAVRMAYQAGQEDEALEPIIKVDSRGTPVGRLENGDSVIFYNIRGEREIELTRSLTDVDFPHFQRKKKLNLNFVTMIEYASSLRAKVAFPPEEIKNTLAEVVSRAGHRLVKIAESEKAPHIGFFMNGKRDEVFPGEERIIVPSPHGVPSYAQTPEMSASRVAEEICSRLADSSCALIVANLANVDVVGHIENKASVMRAIEAVDRALGKIAEAAETNGVTLIVTSDHGTVEDWLYPDGSVNTGHTKSPVPFIMANFGSGDSGALSLRTEGELADVAPTVLELLSMEKPSEMMGQSLLSSPAWKSNRESRRRVLLLILDGWGMRDAENGNLIWEAATPHFDGLWAAWPRSLLKASGEAVGMPPGTVGNSESGHLHIGSGRRVLLDRVKIDTAIEDGSFYRNPVFLEAMVKTKAGKESLHLMGIISHYSSHGTIRHLFALLRMAEEQGVDRVYVHGFIGRRGEKPESGAIYVEKVEETADVLSCGEVVTVIGRYWALDREENWERVEKAYRALVYGEGIRIGPFGSGKTEN